MPIFYGKSEDGSDAKEFEGFYINPENPNEWSNKPYVIQRLQSPFKEFEPKCKHKFHQYTETRRKEGNIIISEWTCSCGKKL